MPNYNQNRFSGNSFGGDRRGGGGRKPSFGGRDSGPKEMFPAVCDNCGRDCQVPFRPSGSKPIFCKDCFEDNNDYDGDRRPAHKPHHHHDHGGNDTAVKQQLEAIHTKLDKILKALETQE
jgi:CxxC-x17-CxxC domain-containing protein